MGLLIEKFVDPRYNLSNQPILNEDGSLRIEALDNHTMRTLFEEVICMFNEETNITDAGRRFTPRDIVELMADLAFVPDAWIDYQSVVKGYELSFTKYFYKPVKMRDVEDIINDIKEIEKSTDGLLASIIGETV